jgi:hypothetical protein
MKKMTTGIAVIACAKYYMRCDENFQLQDSMLDSWSKKYLSAVYNDGFLYDSLLRRQPPFHQCSYFGEILRWIGR